MTAGKSLEASQARICQLAVSGRTAAEAGGPAGQVQVAEARADACVMCRERDADATVAFVPYSCARRWVPQQASRH